MNLLDFEIKMRKDHVKWQKNHLKRAWMLGLIHPTLILWCGVNLYLTPSNWVHGVSFGINIASFIFYIIVMLDAKRDYQSDCRILEWYETKYKENYESDN